MTADPKDIDALQVPERISVWRDSGGNQAWVVTGTNYVPPNGATGLPGVWTAEYVPLAAYREKAAEADELLRAMTDACETALRRAEKAEAELVKVQTNRDAWHEQACKEAAELASTKAELMRAREALEKANVAIGMLSSCYRCDGAMVLGQQDFHVDCPPNDDDEAGVDPPELDGPVLDAIEALNAILTPATKKDPTP